RESALIPYLQLFDDRGGKCPRHDFESLRRRMLVVAADVAAVSAHRGEDVHQRRAFTLRERLDALIEAGNHPGHTIPRTIEALRRKRREKNCHAAAARRP